MNLIVKMPNLSLTRGEIPPEMMATGRARNLGKRLRSLAGWGALGLLFFLVFAWVAIPTKAIAWRIGYEARRAGYSIDVEDLSVYPWGSATLHDVTWTYEPSRVDTPPLNYFMDEVEVDVSILSLMVGNLDIEVEHRREAGRYYARYQRSGDESSIRLLVEELPLYDVPKATQALGVPLTGLVKLDVDVTMPENKFALAQGTIEIECSACLAGDGESKLFIPGSKGSLNKDGLTIPEIDLGTLTGTFVVADGEARIQDAITTESKDLTLSLTGGLQLKDPFGKSWFQMVLKVALTDELLENSERVRFMYSSASDLSKLKAPERGLGFKLEGPVAKPKFVGINTKSRRDRQAERRQRQRERESRRRTRQPPTRGMPPKAGDTAGASGPTDDDGKKDEDDAKGEEEKKDDGEEEKKDDEEERPPLNIEPIEEEPEPAEEPPALPPPDEGEEEEVVEVIDEPVADPPPEQPADGQDGGGSGGEQGQ